MASSAEAVGVGCAGVVGLAGVEVVTLTVGCAEVMREREAGGGDSEARRIGGDGIGVSGRAEVMREREAGGGDSVARRIGGDGIGVSGIRSGAPSPVSPSSCATTALALNRRAVLLEATARSASVGAGGDLHRRCFCGRSFSDSDSGSDDSIRRRLPPALDFRLGVGPMSESESESESDSESESGPGPGSEFEFESESESEPEPEFD